jgi:hypothetical protein
VASGLFRLGWYCNWFGLRRTAARVYSLVVRVGTGLSDVTLDRTVAYALHNAGDALSRPASAGAAMAMYDRLLVRFGRTRDEHVRGILISAQVSKAGLLIHLGRNREAIAMLEPLTRRHRHARVRGLSPSEPQPWLRHLQRG